MDEQRVAAAAGAREAAAVGGEQLVPGLAVPGYGRGAGGARLAAMAAGGGDAVVTVADGWEVVTDVAEEGGGQEAVGAAGGERVAVLAADGGADGVWVHPSG